MAAPSLSEIQNYKGDADIAGGTAGIGDAVPAPVVNDNDELFKRIHERSVAQANYNQYLGTMYQNNLTNAVTNLRNIDYSKALVSDQPALRKSYADFASQLGQDFDVVRNPNVDPARFAQLTSMETDLRGKIGQSTAHNAISDYNKKMLQLNPGWNTPENQKRIQDFEATPLDDRKDFLLKTPYSFDPVKYGKVIADLVQEDVKTQHKDKNWIYTEEGKKYAKDKFKAAYKAGLTNTVNNGRPLLEDYNDSYDALPSDLKKGKTKEDYLDQMIESVIPSTSLSSTIQANPYGVQAQSQSFQAREAQLNRDFQATQAQKTRDFQLQIAEDNGKPKPIVAGENVGRSLAVTFTPGGTLDEKSGQNIYGRSNKITKDTWTALPDGQTPAKDDGANAIIVTDPNTGKETWKIKTGKQEVPEVEFKGTTFDPKTGNIIVHRINNVTGKSEDFVRTPEQAYTDFDRILGDNNANITSNGKALFNKRHFKSESASVKKYIDYFKQLHDEEQGTGTPTTPLPAAAPGTLSDDKFNELLRKNNLLK